MFILNPSRFASASGGGNGLLNGLYVYYSLDESAGPWSDAVGNQGDLSVDLGSPAVTTGLQGNAVEFFGADTISGVRDNSVSVPDCSLSVWVYFNSWGSGDHGVWYGDCLGITLGNNLLIDFPNRHLFAASSYLPIQAWHHICCVADATHGTQKVYIDGVLRDVVTGYTGPWSAGFSQRGLGKQSGRYMDGKIDEYCVAHAAWTDDGANTVGDTAGGQVAALYNSGNGLPYSSFTP